MTEPQGGPFITHTPITAWDRVYYTNGACWSLAWQIYRLTEKPHVICTLGDKGDWAVKDWYHVLVKIGPNKYLDIEGLHTAKQLKERWMLGTTAFGFEIIEHPEFKNATQFKRHIGTDRWRELVDTNYSHTVRTAQFLIERYAHD